MAYHIGASIKDAGKKCFGISLMKDNEIVIELLNRLKFFNAFKLKVILFLHISFYSFDMIAVI